MAEPASRTTLDLESLVAACLESDDPDAELRRRTSDRPDVLPLAQTILARVRAAESAANSGEAPTEIGPYRIVRALGTGGMGTVYLAEQREPLRRQVAIKLVKLGMDSAEILRRFEFERRALAMMSHDNIARVIDAGRTPRGQPYFVMEYVPGIPLDRFADQRTLPIRGRIELFLQVCAGVQHAHQRGVVHRDLKPANILVVDQDGRGVPKIIDFGLARATDRRLHEASLTVEGALLGTPAYMSPEQTGRSDDAIDTRTDVYALGVILYELLTGRLPFAHDELVAAGYARMVQLIRDVEPPPPSRRLQQRGAETTAAAKARRTTPAALESALRADLDAVVSTAMAKEPERRYPAASELAADLRRFLADEPVTARAPSTAYRLRKLVRRYRVQFAAAAVVFATLVGGLAVSLFFYLEAVRAHSETLRAKDSLDPVVLRGLEREAEEDLWPVHPDLVPRLESWLQRAEGIRSRVLVQRNALAGLEERLRREAAIDPSLLAQREELVRLVAGYERFFASSARASNVAGVAARLGLARSVRQRTIEAFARSWQEAREAIAAADGQRASRLYRDLRLSPQLGLVPLGPDPVSKLWEFYHPDSGEAGAKPERDPATGKVRMTSGMGFVLVLLPGGTFTMGSDQTHDPDAEKDELPRHEVTLSPFFISKFECTQAQWRRMCDDDAPSRFTPGRGMPAGFPAVSERHPVEQVGWTAVTQALARWELALPTEAQWEFAARAGADTVFPEGDDPSTLKGRANLADAFAIRFGTSWPAAVPWEDGCIVHAAVGEFLPNRFGLHDMLGNVGEMCADAELPYTVPPRAGDGLRSAGPSGGQAITVRIGRGGSWQFDHRKARCADRQEVQVHITSDLVGFRASRPLHHDHR